jgi:hypothetical protein
MQALVLLTSQSFIFPFLFLSSLCKSYNPTVLFLPCGKEILLRWGTHSDDEEDEAVYHSHRCEGGQKNIDLR